MLGRVRVVLVVGAGWLVIVLVGFAGNPVVVWNDWPLRPPAGKGARIVVAAPSNDNWQLDYFTFQITENETTLQPGLAALELHSLRPFLRWARHQLGIKNDPTTTFRPKPGETSNPK